ncbi:MAG: DUF4870 domain-containing protein [Thermincola sp.]|jgi:uncharacterized Tic20 family protein|nr:DUF4870 domain-containing protein [Thermincola sp.]MDT3702692.1 DUF4870 domain-containing protein [Thermincola sp.]
MEPTSEERILAGFSHLMIIFGWYGTAAAFAIWLARRGKSEFIRNSVMQALVYQIPALSLMSGISYLGRPAIIKILSAYNALLTPENLGAVSVLVGSSLFLYGVVGAAATFRGRKFKYVLLGNLVDKYF